MVVDDWNPRFTDFNPLFAPFAHFVHCWELHREWPDLSLCNALLMHGEGPIRTGGGASLHAVSQAPRTRELAQHYELRIHNRGELQTRSRNWHDWFNVLVWRTFPQSKSALNSVHCETLQQVNSAALPHLARSARANACTLFDENGAVVLASDPALLELVREFRWRELFWNRRAALDQSLRCAVFGHSLLEKALHPYVGMTAHAVLLPVTEKTLQLPWPELLPWLDTNLADVLRNSPILSSPQHLQPFPLLGMPGWDPDNAQADYYDNKNYFREGRRR